MKVVGIVDRLEKDGITLIENLSKELTSRGHKVALIKCITNTQSSIDKRANAAEVYAQTIINCFPGETIFSFKNTRPLENILAFLPLFSVSLHF